MLSPNVSLRLAQESDYEDIIRMAKRHLSGSFYRDMVVSDKRISSVCDSLVHGPASEGIIIVGIVDDNPVGCIIGVVNSPTFSEERVSIELLWWVDEEHRPSGLGKELHRAYEYWAKNIAKVDYIGLALFEDGNTKALSRLYRIDGYSPFEHIHMKKVN